MTGEAGLITVYRSADMNARQDATAIRDLLVQNGLTAVMCDDSTPGVVSGTYEVRVPPEESGRAETLVASVDQDDPGAADPSPELDMVTIAELQGATGEIEAIGIKSVLDASGIASVLVGNSTLPNLSFMVKVAKANVDAAALALAEARAAGPAAAVEAQREQSEGREV